MEQLSGVIEPATYPADFLLSDLTHEFEYSADGIEDDLRGPLMEIVEIPVPPPVVNTPCPFVVWITVWCNNLELVLYSASRLRGPETTAQKCTLKVQCIYRVFDPIIAHLKPGCVVYPNPHIHTSSAAHIHILGGSCLAFG